ncbi:tRNA pseudouridine(55) synthase TruB [Sphingomonas ginkgonis]|uniref:tRNA pseudouridine synthase B n=1 Tax=Sphingomonas ginkgonis TaxID=2315330 RepID=A0A3R9Z7I6_9SPHN|nr:tRNA pseudouridine(55) synthase TruB [Sphingomonas ginkgonis]RST31719.1 tRNA pseudouridine(55) synthase TruB [Sphingomonas ginkgonis]
MLNGWIILDKPLGLGSTQAVSAVKRALREAGEPRTKVGHGGTLDPLATGVLPVALGEATKLAGRMLDATKGYDFTVRFGVETDTLDLEGKEVAVSGHRPTLAEIEALLPRFTGPIEQVPPAYSALKVEGKRAYDLARAGEEVTLAARKVTIHSLVIRHPRESGGPASCPGSGGKLDPRFRGDDGRGLGGDGAVHEITLAATVSKGTYIRSLARDIARALGTVGHVTMLRRTKAGPFTLGQAISLDFLSQAAKARDLTRTVLPLQAGLDDIPALPVDPDQAKLLRQGQRLAGLPVKPGLYLATLAETPVALVQASALDLWVVRGFNV